MPISNPRIGKLINWRQSYVGDPADSVNLGIPMAEDFNHLRRYRAMEYIASYSGRIAPFPADAADINGNHLSKFHIISRYPVRENGGAAEIVINAHNWRHEYVAGNETWEWYNDMGDLFATRTILKNVAASTTGGDDDANDYPSGEYGEWFDGLDATNAAKSLTITPVAIGTDDGFRCSRLDVTNAIVHRLNVMGCPHEPTLTEAEALVSSSDFSVDEVIKGWDEANADDGTVGTVCHYLDAGDSVIHNSSRALFNTPYALGVYQTGVNPAESLRQDADGNAQTYRVKPRNLTGAAGNVDCDPAIVVYGGAGCVVTMSSSVAADSVSYTIPGGGLLEPTLVTVSSFTDQLEVDDELDYITVSGTSAGGIELFVQAVSLWEPYQHR